MIQTMIRAAERPKARELPVNSVILSARREKLNRLSGRGEIGWLESVV